MKPRLTRVHSGYNSGEAYVFDCPGCGCMHMVAVSYGPEYVQRRGSKGPEWTFNGSLERPTFSPSLLVREFHGDQVVRVCHSWIRDGKIEFLGDCTHDQAGKTLDLADVEG